MIQSFPSESRNAAGAAAALRVQPAGVWRCRLFRLDFASRPNLRGSGPGFRWALLLFCNLFFVSHYVSLLFFADNNATSFLIRGRRVPRGDPRGLKQRGKLSPVA